MAQKRVLLVIVSASISYFKELNLKAAICLKSKVKLTMVLKTPNMPTKKLVTY